MNTTLSCSEPRSSPKLDDCRYRQSPSQQLKFAESEEQLRQTVDTQKVSRDPV